MCEKNKTKICILQNFLCDVILWNYGLKRKYIQYINIVTIYTSMTKGSCEKVFFEMPRLVPDSLKFLRLNASDSLTYLLTNRVVYIVVLQLKT